uniref:Uncharacterized protein n=1 Tax=Lepeophtheirus salmonis TaxID=72036 RepID=A0A0K2UST1_LEPSM
MEKFIFLPKKTLFLVEAKYVVLNAKSMVSYSFALMMSAGSISKFEGVVQHILLLSGGAKTHLR